MSFDDYDKNEDWAKEEGMLFELWTDEDKTLAVTYGSVENDSAAWANRVTRILDAEGVLLIEYDSVSVGVHPAQVLEDCQTVFGQ